MGLLLLEGIVGGAGRITFCFPVATHCALSIKTTLVLEHVLEFRPRARATSDAKDSPAFLFDLARKDHFLARSTDVQPAAGSR